MCGGFGLLLGERKVVVVVCVYIVDRGGKKEMMDFWSNMVLRCGADEPANICPVVEVDDCGRKGKKNWYHNSSSYYSFLETPKSQSDQTTAVTHTHTHTHPNTIAIERKQERPSHA